MWKPKKQLTFNILPIDEKATCRAVEEYLETVRQHRQIGLVRREIAVTQDNISPLMRLASRLNGLRFIMLIKRLNLRGKSVYLV